MKEMPIEKHVLVAHVPVCLKMPEQMRNNLRKVMTGEYEPGYFGRGLRILDLGANAGSFSLWANMRWPASTIFAYEPHPETFQILQENVQGLTNISCCNAAVYPIDKATQPFFARWPGDGEAGLAAVMAKTFSRLPQERVFDVRTVHPRTLPACDIVKLDVEGSEFEILAHMDLAAVSLIILEFQFASIRDSIKQLLATDFIVEHESSYPWADILQYADYRQDLAGDSYGLLQFSNRLRNKLTKCPIPA